MLKNKEADKSGAPGVEKKPLSKAARRALKEAAARREASKQKADQREIGGREGPDPARYGDWENKGIASDF